MSGPTCVRVYLAFPEKDVAWDKIVVETSGMAKVCIARSKGSRQQKAFCIGLLLARFQFERMAALTWTLLATTDKASWAKTMTGVLTREGFRGKTPGWWAELEDKFGTQIVPFVPSDSREMSVLRYRDDADAVFWSPRRLFFVGPDGRELEAETLLETARAIEDSVEEWETIIPALSAFPAPPEKKEEAGAPAPVDELPALLTKYLIQVARRNGWVRPLGDLGVSFAMEELPIDLPLRLAYAYPRPDQPLLTPGASIQDVETAGLRLWQDRLAAERARNTQSERTTRIAEWLRAEARLIVVGDPGCGKSTLLSSLAWLYALRSLPEAVREAEFPGALDRAPAHAQLGDQPRVPILISFKNGSNHFSQYGLRALVTKTVAEFVSAPEVEPLADLLVARLHAGGALLLVDGVDELASARQRRALCDSLTEEARGWPGMPTVISSRWIGFTAVGEILRYNFDSFNVRPLGDLERKSLVRSLVGKLGLPAPSRKERCDALERQVCEGGTLANICDSVMLLTQVVSLNAFDETPHTKARVFRRTIAHLLARQREGGGPELVEGDVVRKLAWLAYKMHEDEKSKWPEPTVIECLRDKFWSTPETGGREFEHQRSVQAWLDGVIEGTGLLHVGGLGAEDEHGEAPRMIQFFHPYLQEYFLSRGLGFAQRHPSP